MFLTVVGVLGTLLAIGKANEVAEQGGWILPFWVAYAAEAACWCVYDLHHLQAVRRGRVRGRTRRAAIAWPRRGW